MNGPGLNRDVHSLTLSIQAFPLQTTASPTLQGALNNVFREAVVACVTTRLGNLRYVYVCNYYVHNTFYECTSLPVSKCIIQKVIDHTSLSSAWSCQFCTQVNNYTSHTR